MTEFIFSLDREWAFSSTYGRSLSGPGIASVLDPKPIQPFVLKNTEEGQPAPSLATQGGFAWKLLWPVDPGQRTISVWCKSDGLSPPPALRVKADPELGVNQDAYDEATESGWQRLLVSVQVSQKGVLVVHLEARGSFRQTLWDKIEVS